MLATLDNLGAIGVVEDAYAPEIAANAWTDARNVRFREGYAEKMRGHAPPYGSAQVVPYHLQPFTVGTSRYWLYAGLNKVYAVNNLNVHTNITRQSAGVDVDYAATADARWNGAALSGFAVLNNGTDLPQYWGGSGRLLGMDAISGWAATTRCRVIRSFREYLLALNVTKAGVNYPHMVKWSHAADPGTMPTSWDHTDATKDAGEADLADDQTALVDGLALGDQFIAYKGGAAYSLSWVGPPHIFSIRKLSGIPGALTTGCVAEIPGAHVVMGQGDIFVHSGNTLRSIVTPTVRRWLYGQLDEATYVRSFVAANPAQNEVWICFVPYGQATARLALIWNWIENTFSVRELPGVVHAAAGVIDSIAANTWNADVEPWNADTSLWNEAPDITASSQRLLMASASDAAIFLADQSRTFNGSAITAYVQREGVDFGEPKRLKLLKRLLPIFDADAGTEISIRAGASMSPGDAVTWGAYETFTVGTSVEVYPYVQGRYLAWEFRSSALTDGWRIKRMDVEYDTQGGW